VETRDDAAATGVGRRVDDFLEGFEEAMDDDLNAAGALGALFSFVSEVNAELDAAGDRISTEDRDRALDALASADDVLGLLALARRDRALDPETVSRVEERVRERERARAEGAYERADRIRDELAREGIVLEDTARGTRWKVERKAVASKG